MKREINSGMFQKGHKHSDIIKQKIREARTKQDNSKLPRGEHHPKWKGGLPKCEICGVNINYRAKRCVKHVIRKYWLGKNRSNEFKLKVRGENSIHWIKDRSKLKISENKQQDSLYRIWSLKTKRRDNFKCRLLSVECKGRIESHHIFNWMDYPELRYVINNGITLCHAHHPLGRAKEKRMIPIFQELLSVSEECNEK